MVLFTRLLIPHTTPTHPLVKKSPLPKTKVYLKEKKITPHTPPPLRGNNFSLFVNELRLSLRDKQGINYFITKTGWWNSGVVCDEKFSDIYFHTYMPSSKTIQYFINSCSLNVVFPSFIISTLHPGTRGDEGKVLYAAIQPTELV